MKPKNSAIKVILTTIVLSTLNSQLSTAFAQGTAFTYQGRLNDGANLANGNYDLTAAIFGVTTGGSPVAGPLTNSSVGVSNGLFTVLLDFGAGVFNGNSRWLEIAVRPTGGASFTTLSPRQPITASPYAIFAGNGSTGSGPWLLNGTNIFYNAGNVGVGTTTPGAKLHVKTADEGLRIQGASTGNANVAYASFYDTAGTRIGYVGDGSTGDKSVFLQSDSADVVLSTAAGRILDVSPGGLVTISGPPVFGHLSVFAGDQNGPNIAGTAIRAVGGAGNFGGDGGAFYGGNASGAGHQGGRAIFAYAGVGSGGATDGLAGDFQGNVVVGGTLTKAGGSFKIDHPLDPANKYLYHSFVESPDMKNIYDGTIITDQNGDAVVQLPDWFEALNRDFRYQLTVIGTFAQAIVAEKIKNNRFTIKTSAQGVEVSWQVTGIRQDAFANQNRIPVEEAKPEKERGYYLHPIALGQPEEKGVEYAREPELMQKIKEQREPQSKTN